MSTGHLLALSLLALTGPEKTAAEGTVCRPQREGTGPSLQGGPLLLLSSSSILWLRVIINNVFLPSNYHHLQRMCPHYPSTDHSPWKWSPSSGPLDQLSRGLCVLSGTRLQLRGPLITPDSQGKSVLSSDALGKHPLPRTTNTPAAKESAQPVSPLLHLGLNGILVSNSQQLL